MSPLCLLVCVHFLCNYALCLYEMKCISLCVSTCTLRIDVCIRILSYNSVFICMCVCVYVFLSVHINYASIRLYLNPSTFISICLRACVFTNTYTHTHLHSNPRIILPVSRYMVTYNLYFLFSTGAVRFMRTFSCICLRDGFIGILNKMWMSLDNGCLHICSWRAESDRITLDNRISILCMESRCVKVMSALGGNLVGSILC